MKKIQLRSILLALLWIVCLLPFASPPARAANNSIDIWYRDDWMDFCEQLQNEGKGFFTGKTVNLFADIAIGSAAGNAFC